MTAGAPRACRREVIVKYPVEVFDSLQLLYAVKGFNDHQIHCLVRFVSAPQEATLRRAVALSLRSFPILATRYATGPGLPAWESLAEPDLDPAFAATDDEKAFAAETTVRLDEGVGPQVRVALLHGRHNALSVTMNHMIADGSGFKRYLYFLCDTYSTLVDDPAFTPSRISIGDRSPRDVVRSFSPLARVHAMIAGVNRPGKFSFPLEKEGDVRPFIATRTLDRKKVSKLRDFCKRRGATINDAALAAYYRSLARRIGERAWEGLEIPIMVDMRRYAPETEIASLRNLSSMVITQIRQKDGERFEETLLKVKTAMDGLKKRRIGLGGFVKLSLVYSVCGERLGSRFLKRALETPLICMTNVGELDSQRLSFKGSPVESAFLCGSIKYKPHFQLALSGFDGTLTLSSNLYGSSKDRQRIDSFLQEVEGELGLGEATGAANRFQK
jgi:NRPS condensation-like uncharacterized protein